MFLDDIVSPLTVKEAATDYQKRRQCERDVDAGKPVSRQAKNPQTDYAKKRARDKKELELGEEQVNELSKGTLANYVKANANDQVQHASSQSYVSGKNGDKYNTADAWDQRTTKREKGMDRALNKLSQVEEDSWHAGDNAWSSDKNQWSESMDASEPSPVTGAITRRILSQRLDLLKQYGPELVGAAVDNVADYVGDVEEIGSSDVSAWVAQVERMLKENPPEAFDQDMEEGVWDNIKKSFTPDPNWQKRAGQQAGHIAQGAVAGGVHGHAVGHSMADAGVAEDADHPHDRGMEDAKAGKEYDDSMYSNHQDKESYRRGRIVAKQQAKKGVAEAGYSNYDNNRKGFSRPGREDDEYYVPDPVEPQYNIKVNGQVINQQPFANRTEALTWAKQAVAAGKLDPKNSVLSPINQVNELSNDTLASYKKAAGADASAADKAGNYERGNKRFKGIVKATVKQGDNDAKKHVKESYWTKLENERNTKIAKLVNELKESVK